MDPHTAEVLTARLLSPSLAARRARSSTLSSESVPLSPPQVTPLGSPVLSANAFDTPAHSHLDVLSTGLSSLDITPLFGVCTEEEINATPLAGSHKELALLHLRRLLRIAMEDDPHAIPAYTTKRVAREQLARMTIVIRNFVAHYRRKHRQIPERLDKGDCACGESIIMDIIDASFSVPGVTGNLTIPAFPLPLRDYNELEVAALVRESYAHELGDPEMEPWPIYYEHVVPGGPVNTAGENIGGHIDWGTMCRRSSDDHVKYYRGNEPAEILALKKAAIHLRDVMQKGRKTRNTHSWPPTGRPRSASETDVVIDWEEVKQHIQAKRVAAEMSMLGV
ncbi:hypothetical protein LTR56_015576 [Elasticomyces elasticus]|nr:hypothetical protein LTR56_015576 [Elasticomyces elasticus]KAK3648275.1 hypothetical protein LTR22_013406 [Elasticomyces elasticus]KAK4903059.1 hypothetical protein LTR49_026883 [Elasticomyces elasticus]KAK5737279.1 hypothetical protein LTS12_025949 [Elasticomyces elasticus]